MANSVTTDLPPSTYFASQTVHLQLAGIVDVISYTVNGLQPTLSEYIAYDTLVPPNPFIAVTQDGKGRVVYDGGFPKFYNGVAPAMGTPFSGLSASFKYLYNALKWVANATKVAGGNNKVLFLGDTLSDASYPVKGIGPTGFKTAMEHICSIAGFVPTFRDISDYPGGKLNFTLAELDEFCAAVMFSTAFTVGNPDLITQPAINDMLTYRTNGNGLIFITDHGLGTLTDVNQVKLTPEGDGFYATANRVIANFGAFFTGNFDRSPVNVGFLRATYGDHPLYNGMTNGEDISAGGSESKVVVSTYPTYTQETVPPIPMTTDGRYTIRILARMDDGSVETYQYVFAIITGGVVEIRDGGGTPITQIDTGFGDNVTVFPVVIGSGLGTLSGQVTVGGVKVADLLFTEAGGSTVTWLDGTQVTHVNDTDIIRAEITSPFTYYVDVEVTRFQPNLDFTSSVPNVMELMREWFTDANVKSTIQQAVEATGNTYKTSFAQNVAILAAYMKR